MKRWFKQSNSPDNKLRIEIYRQNLEIIKRGSYLTASGKAIRLSDRERLLNHTEMYDTPIEYHSEAVTSKTITGTIEADCLYVSKALIERGWNPAVLNLADEKLAGGFVYGGSRAQEEELCRRSTLMLSLFPRYSEEYAELVGTTLALTPRYPMDKDFGGVYSPGVTVIRDTIQTNYALLDSPFTLSVISVAAINRPTFDEETLKIKNPKAIEREKNKIRTILRIGLLHGHDSLVLGAFGCGAFHTPPSHVAQLFAEIFNEPEFKNKYKGLFFAVLEGRKENHNPEGNVKPFADVFGRMDLDNIPSIETRPSRKEPEQEYITNESQNSKTKVSQENNQKTLINNIRLLMMSRGYNQSSLARALGKQPVVINRALNGKVAISAKMLMEMAQLFGVSIEKLNGKMKKPAIYINGFIEYNGTIRKISSVQDLKAAYDDITSVSES